MPRYGATTADSLKINLRRRARKSRENQTRNQSVDQQTVIGFDASTSKFGKQSDRMNRAVTDSGKRLNAKEKRAQKKLSIGNFRSVNQTARAERRVNQTENDVAQKI